MMRMLALSALLLAATALIAQAQAPIYSKTILLGAGAPSTLMQIFTSSGAPSASAPNGSIALTPAGMWQRVGGAWQSMSMVSAGAYGQIAYYRNDGSVVSGNPELTFSSGAMSLGSMADPGSLKLQGPLGGFTQFVPASKLGFVVLTAPMTGGTIATQSYVTGLGYATSSALSAEQTRAQAAEVLATPLANASAANVTATGASAARTLAVRAADTVNVLDFGAALNGSTDDLAAFNAARTAAGSWGTVRVPAGLMQLSNNPTSGTGPVLWQMTGNTYNDYATPAVGWQITGDVIETFLGSSGKYFGRGATTAASGPVVRVDASVTHTGGTAGAVIAPLTVNVSIPSEGSALNNFVWGVLSQITSAATGPGEHVAVVGSATRTAAGSGIWGADFMSVDRTGLASVTAGAQIGLEMDLNAQGADSGGAAVNVIPAGAGIRVMQDLVGGPYGSGNTVEIGWGSRLTLGNNADGANGGHYKRGYSVIAPFSIAAFDASLATEKAGAAAVLLAAGQHVCFDASAAHCLSFNSGTGKLGYYVSGSLVFSVDASGGTGAAQTASNLSDLASASTARTNLGLGGLAVAGYPSAGLVHSTGAAFGAETIGAGLTESGGTLSAVGYTLPEATPSTLGGVKPDGTTINNSAGAISVTYGTAAGTAAQGNDSRIVNASPLPAVSNTYAASGAIAVSDVLSIVNASSAVSMTLGSGSDDGHELTVKRWGAGAVTVTASIDGSSQSIILQSAALKEALTLDWSVSLSTWIMR